MWCRKTSRVSSPVSGQSGTRSSGTDRGKASAQAGGKAATDRALRQGGVLLRWRAGQYGLGFLSALVIARVLGPAGRAQYALPLNLATLVWVGIHLSLESAVARMLGRREVTFEVMTRICLEAALALGVAGFAVMEALGQVLRSSALANASEVSITLVAVSIPFTILAQFVTALLLRQGRTATYGRLLAVSALLQLAGLVGLWAVARLSPETTLAVNLAIQVLIAVVLLAALTRQIDLEAVVTSPPVGMRRRVYGAGISLHLSSIALYLNLRVDLFLVGLLLSARRAGLYSLSTTLAELVLVATWTLSLAALRDQTDLPQEDAVGYTLEFVRQSIVMATGFVLVLSAVSYPLVTLAYGAAWRGSVLPLVILAAGAVGLVIEGPVRGMLFRIARPVTISAFSAGAMILNVVLNLVLIPRLGIDGAALSSLVSYWVAGLLMLMLLSRHTSHPVLVVFSRPRRGDIMVAAVGRVLRLTRVQD
jgi:O-antigen/teichoic acid export membrane protein